MKQRLGLANALLMRRELLVLDEPTNGLDPQGTREVRALIRSLADDGTTVFVSSHLLAEVEQVCSHVAVMSVGRLVAQGTLDEFRSGGETRVLVRTPDAGRAREVLARLGLELDGHAGEAGAGDIRSVTDAAGDALVAARLVGANGAAGDSAPTSPPAAEEIVAGLVAAGVRVRGFELERASLEQRFVDLTGEGFDVVQ